MAWLVALIPVFTAILAWLFLSEKFGVIKIIGLAIAFAGAIIVVTRDSFTNHNGRGRWRASPVIFHPHAGSMIQT